MFKQRGIHHEKMGDKIRGVAASKQKAVLPSGANL